MLDKFIRAVVDRLDRLKVQVDEVRADLERERMGDTARTHAAQMLRSPKGASTAPRKAAQAAQQRYAAARQEWAKMGGPNLLVQLATLIQAREERDEAAAAFKRHEVDETERLRTGIHVDARPFLEQAYAHGALPRHFANVRPEMAAIVTDLIRWDGHDQAMVDPQSPIRDVRICGQDRPQAGASGIGSEALGSGHTQTTCPLFRQGGVHARRPASGIVDSSSRT